MASLSNHWSRRTTTPVVIVVATLIAMVTGSLIEKSSRPRQKRHILQLCQLISLHTNKGCIEYNNYGCFCGLGSADSRPVDAVDKCCRAHDRCYGKIDCFWLYPQFVGYSYECGHNGCQCADSQLISLCSHSTCRCDMKFARCLGRAQYHDQYRNYNRQYCRKPASDRGDTTTKIKTNLKKRLKQKRKTNYS